MNQSVISAIVSHLGPTTSLGILTEIIALALALPMGILAARRKGTATDQTVMSFSLLGMSVPNFLLGFFDPDLLRHAALAPGRGIPTA